MSTYKGRHGANCGGNAFHTKHTRKPLKTLSPSTPRNHTKSFTPQQSKTSAIPFPIQLDAIHKGFAAQWNCFYRSLWLWWQPSPTWLRCWGGWSAPPVVALAGKMAVLAWIPNSAAVVVTVARSVQRATILCTVQPLTVASKLTFDPISIFIFCILFPMRTRIVFIYSVTLTRCCSCYPRFSSCVNFGPCYCGTKAGVGALSCNDCTFGP